MLSESDSRRVGRVERDPPRFVCDPVGLAPLNPPYRIGHLHPVPVSGKWRTILLPAAIVQAICRLVKRCLIRHAAEGLRAATRPHAAPMRDVRPRRVARAERASTGGFDLPRTLSGRCRGCGTPHGRRPRGPVAPSRAPPQGGGSQFVMAAAGAVAATRSRERVPRQRQHCSAVSAQGVPHPLPVPLANVPARFHVFIFTIASVPRRFPAAT